MTEEALSGAAKTASGDLAFMKAVIEDRGPLAGVFGMHMFWPGLIYGINFIYIWAIAAGLADWPWEGLSWTWVPGTILYVPIPFYLWWRHRHMTLGPTARGFAAAWSSVGAMSAATVSALLIATAKTGDPFYEIWPGLAFVIYGGSWMAGAVIRRRWWHGAVAAGSFVIASLSAWRIDQPDMWLVSAVGIILFIAAPGAVIIYLSRKQNAGS